MDRKHKVFHFGDFNTSIVDIADNTVDVEKIIETKMLIEDLYRALDSLNYEERKVIDSLYFKEMTIRDLAKEQQVSSKKIFNFRNKDSKEAKRDT